MKILLVTGPDISLKEPYYSGIEAFIVTLANQLTKEGHHVDVIARDAEPTVLFTIVDLGKGFLRRRSSSDQIKRFEKYIKKTYDVIHYNLFIPELYEVAARSNAPSLLTLHSPADRPRTTTYRKLASRKDITFVAISERIKQQWDAALHTDTTLIHNGIENNQWRTNRTNGQYLLWTARINEEKNVAAAIALAKHLKQPLKIAGRITDQHYFDTAVKPHLNDQIQYIGHATQQTLKRLASRAIAFLATAQWQEPFGLNTLEMLAAGVPVVGFASAIPPDLRDQHVSIAVDSNYWHDLIEPLQSVQSTNAKQCRHFAQTMNIENMTKKYLNLYESLAMNVQQNTPTIDAIEELLPHSVPVEAA